VKKFLFIIGGAVLTAILVLVIIVMQFIKATEIVSEGNPIPNYSEENMALMVVDVQECTTGKYSTDHTYQNQSSGLFYRVNALIDTAKIRNIPIIYIKNETSHPVINFIDNSMAEGSPGAALDHRMTIASNNIFAKDKQDAFCNPVLDEFLLREKISKIYITGLDAAHCVKSTVQAALNRKYEVVLIEDAIISESNVLKKEAIDEMKSMGANVIFTDNF